jgi:phosphoribosylformylglycinamidine (FGAM) synthase-like enzyme
MGPVAPIVGGNVSLYNEGATGPIYPTPVIGIVGRLPDARRAGRLGFLRDGHHIALVGPFAPALDAGELHKLLGRPLPDGLPEIDVQAVAAAHAAVRHGVREGLVASAHDVAEGGLAVALAECCLAGGIGAQVELTAELWESSSPVAALFGEGPGGFVVSGDADALLALARHAGEAVAVVTIGRVGDDSLTIVEAGAGAGTMLTLTLDELAGAHAALAEWFS